MSTIVLIVAAWVGLDVLIVAVLAFAAWRRDRYIASRMPPMPHDRYPLI